MDLIIIMIVKITGLLTLAVFLAYIILIILGFIAKSVFNFCDLLEIIRYINKNKEVIEEYKTFMSNDEIHKKVLKIIRKEE